MQFKHDIKFVETCLFSNAQFLRALRVDTFDLDLAKGDCGTWGQFPSRAGSVECSGLVPYSSLLFQSNSFQRTRTRRYDWQNNEEIAVA